MFFVKDDEGNINWFNVVLWIIAFTYFIVIMWFVTKWLTS